MAERCDALEESRSVVEWLIKHAQSWAHCPLPAADLLQERTAAALCLAVE